MSQDREDDTTVYRVVVNHEEQFSIWPADYDLPLGWNDAGRTGLKDECLAYINEVWTDMRPLSLRHSMEEAARRRELGIEESVPAEELLDDDQALVRQLSSGPQRVMLTLRAEAASQALQEALERGHVALTFPDTDGGTVLTIKLDPAACNLGQADFERQTGTIHLEGQLTLDFTPVRCRADIELATFGGRGQLSPLA